MILAPNNLKQTKAVSKCNTYYQFVALTFVQLNKCYTLRDIYIKIGVCETLISDLGLSQSSARSTISEGDRKHNWKVYKSLYSELLKQ